MYGGARGEPLSDIDHGTGGLEIAQSEVAALHAATVEKPLGPVGVDELQGTDVTVDEHRKNQRAIVLPGSVRLDLLADEIGMIQRCIVSRGPECARVDRRVGPLSSTVLIAQTSRGRHPGAMSRVLGRVQGPADFRVPRFRASRPPVTEGSGRDAVAVEDVPTGRVTGVAVGGETVERAVWLDHLRRL